MHGQKYSTVICFFTWSLTRQIVPCIHTKYLEKHGQSLRAHGMFCWLTHIQTPQTKFDTLRIWPLFSITIDGRRDGGARCSATLYDSIWSMLGMMWEWKHRGWMPRWRHWSYTTWSYLLTFSYLASSRYLHCAKSGKLSTVIFAKKDTKSSKSIKWMAAAE